MKRRVLVLSSTLLALAAIAPAGASAKPARHDRCIPRAHEEVRARSSSAAVLLRRTRVLVGCSTATGRRRVIDTTDGSSASFEQVRVRATVVAYVITEASRYADAMSQLYRDDAVRAGRHWDLERASVVSDVAIGPGGMIAHVTQGDPALVLRLDRADGTRLDVDAALRLRDVRFSGDRLVWRHGTATQSTDSTPTDHCGGHSGTLALALTPHIRPDAITACLRATGASRTLATSATHHIATAGPWIAAAPADGDTTNTIITANLSSTAGEAIPATGRVGGLAINANGTVAWLTLAAPDGGTPLLVHDTTGTRVLDTAFGVIAFGFDGTILRYGPMTVQLPR